MKEIFEVSCKQCGRHICFTHSKKYSEQEIFCSGKCAMDYEREIKKKLERKK